MKILMMTNTFTPITGGVEKSINSFSIELEKLGHEVIIVAPEFDGTPADEVNVIRLHAIKRIGHTDFSMALPMSRLLPKLMKNYSPDIIHSHHPFWMGDIALRLSWKYHIPLVFTYHTMFEYYLHYLPIQKEGIKRFIIELFAGYANLANKVIVPSESVREILEGRGVKTPIIVIPTGVELKNFSKGDSKRVRGQFNIPANAFVIGYVGRLVKEKNLEFLSKSVAGFLKKETTAHFIIAGYGPLLKIMEKIFYESKVDKRIHFYGILRNQDLVDFYHSMDVFAFASISETQGIVLTEAMASGVPVVALDAPGIREVLKDKYNGRMINYQKTENYIEALSWCFNLNKDEMLHLRKNAKKTTKKFSLQLSVNKLIHLYRKVMIEEYVSSEKKDLRWYSLADRLKKEWDLFKNMLQAGKSAITDSIGLNNISKNEKINKKPKIHGFYSI